MATAYTSLLGLALPVTGELSGSWGDTVNTAITSLLDNAVAGTTSLTTDADVTLSTTVGIANQARQAIILWNPASGTVTRNITVPAQSKIYTVINASGGTQSIVIRGAGPTTGVTIIKGESAVVAWNGTDFIKISNTGGGGSFTNVTISGTTTLSGLTASTALALDASKNVVSVTNTGTGNNVLATSPTLVTPALGTPTALVGTNITGTAANFNINGTVGATTANTGAFTTLTTSGAVTHNAGTANGVAYLNGSKVLTTGSALTFDGTNLGVGTPNPVAYANFSSLTIQGTNGGTLNLRNSTASIQFAIETTSASTILKTIASEPLVFGINNTEQMRLTSTGLGIGTSSPVGKLHVAGGSVSVGAYQGIFEGGVGGYGAGVSFQSTLTGGSLAEMARITADGEAPWNTTAANQDAGLRFYTALNGTVAEKMRLDSFGNVGIGTSSIPTVGATTVLAVGNSTGGTLGIVQSGSISYRITAASGGVDCYNANATPITWYTNATSRMTLDSSGNLGLGVTPSAWGGAIKAMQLGAAGCIYGQPGNTSLVGVGANFFNNGTDRYINTAPASLNYQFNGAHFWLTAPSGTAGNAISFTQALTLDASGNLLVGTTTARANSLLSVNGGINTDGGVIGFLTSDTFTLNSKTQPSYGFNLNPAGSTPIGISGFYGISFATGNTERARIDSSGNLLVGTTSNPNASHQIWKNNPNGIALSVQNTNTTNGFVLDLVSQSAAGTGFSLIRGYVTSGGTQVFAVQGNGNVVNTNNSYGAISDVKLKENVTDATPKLEKLNQVRVVNYNLIGSEQKQIGVIAQELEQVFPGMVEETPDRDKEGNDLGTTTKSVKYSVFVPMLIKAIQEQQALITALTARITALESN